MTVRPPDVPDLGFGSGPNVEALLPTDGDELRRRAAAAGFSWACVPRASLPLHVRHLLRNDQAEHFYYVCYVPTRCRGYAPVRDVHDNASLDAGLRDAIAVVHRRERDERNPNWWEER